MNTVQLIWEGKIIRLRQSKGNSINVFSKHTGGANVEEDNQLEERKKGFVEEVIIEIGFLSLK